MENPFGKLFKKKDDLSLNDDKPLDLNLGKDKLDFKSEPDFENEFGSAKTSFGESSMNQEPITPAPRSYSRDEPLRESRLEHNDVYMIKKDIEVISSKIDALKSALESMNQRLMNIERIAMSEQQEQRKQW